MKVVKYMIICGWDDKENEAVGAMSLMPANWPGRTSVLCEPKSKISLDVKKIMYRRYHIY